MSGRRWREAGWGGRVLLLAALLLGIVTMHTLGHPSGSAGGAPADQGPASVHAQADMRADMRMDMRAGTSAPAPGPAAADRAAGGHGQSHEEKGHGDGLDPMSVCLAVLGAWTAAALLGVYVFLVVRRRSAVDFFAAVRSRILLALRPLPPPPLADRLASLSVLRI